MTSAERIATLVFWTSALGVVYTYAVYPLLVYVLSRFFGSRTEPSPPCDSELPRITLVIAAYNEEDVIGQRIANALQLDYPADKLQVIVASDGSTDGTARIVEEFASSGVRLLKLPQRRGKASAINAAVAEVTSDLVLLSDANTSFQSAAGRRLVRWFVRSEVGAVCGRLILTDATTGQNVDGLYWRYETFLKKQEGRLGALLGSNGAIYAIRRELLCPIPPNTIVDDFVIPLLAKLRSGCEIIYDSEAVAYEEIAPDVKGEFRRRSRIGAGGWQAIAMLWPLLNPRQGWVAFTFASHKILRWLCPMLLMGAVLSSVALWRIDFYRIIVVAEGILAVIALLGAYVPLRFPGGRFLRLANMFLLMNAALGVGFVRWLATPQTGIWTRTQRSGERPDGAPAGPAADPAERIAPQSVSEAVRVTP